MKIPAPVTLRCEYSSRPMGIDTPFPRFSWQVHHRHRGQLQQCYQILVSQDPKKISNNIGDTWDSGKIDSSDTVNLGYDGLPLCSASAYFWRVRWWDLNGNASPYSDIACFETAFLSGQEWQAEWITMNRPLSFPSIINTLVNGMDEQAPQYHAMYLRKVFSARDAVKRGRVFVTGIGYYEFRLNGRKVGDHLLDPAQTDYQHTALYAAYDVTALLKKGENALGLILGNGRHIKSYGYGRPRGILQMLIEYKNGETQTIRSGPDWKASHGPIMENGIYFGERYDARKEMDGWDTNNFSDSGWETVETITGPPLVSQVMPPIRATSTLQPVSLDNPRPGVFIYDFGQNFTGWARLSVTGPSGTRVTLRFSELLDTNGMLNSAGLNGIEASDTYILKGDGREIFEPTFTYHGFRYVALTGFPGIPTLEALSAVFVHSDVEKTGRFHCANPLINAVHKNVLWGQLSNLMSVPTDCPQRGERMGWMGDAQLAAEEALYNFDMALFFTKYLQDIRLAQKEDGSLSDVIPPYWPLYPADPAWGSAYITIAWYCYLFYDDVRILDEHYSGMKNYIRFLESASEDYVLNKLGRYGDWCPPGSVLPKTTPPELTATWYFFHDTLLLCLMAGILNKKEDAVDLAGLAEKVNRAFNHAFLKNGRYATVDMGPLTELIASSQTSQALPLYLDMAPEGQKEKVLDRLVRTVVDQNDNHVDTGIVGTRYLFEVLTENGHGETAYKVATQRTYPGWGYMLEEGATTLWERWEKLEGSAMNSHNHIMLGSIDAWFYRTLTGLIPMAPGWKKFRIKPRMLGDLTHASATIQTMRGEIHASWEKQDRCLMLYVSIPAGSRAEVHVPMEDNAASVYEGDVLIWEGENPGQQVPGITSIESRGHYLFLNTGSGFYTFKVDLTHSRCNHRMVLA